MSWKIDEIKAKRLARARERFGNTDRDTLIDRIATLEAAMWPFVCTLSDLDVEPGPKRSAWATSKLFPFRDDATGKMQMTDPETKQTTQIDVPDDKLHEVDYWIDESITIQDGSKLSDKLEIIGVHQSDIAAYINCGSIWMEDVRRASKLLFGN